VKSSTKRIDNQKDFNFELDFISRIDAFKNIELRASNDNNLRAFLSRGNLSFNLEINKIFTKDDYIKDIVFSLEDKTYVVEGFNKVIKSTKLSIESVPDLLTSIKLDAFRSTSFQINGHFKAFYPVELEDIKTFNNEFETITHQRNGIKYPFVCLRITIENRKYDVIQLKNENKGYYVFECLEEQSFEDFSSSCYSIQQAIGFINTLMVGGEKFVFDSNGEFYYSNFIRPTLRGLYRPVFSNPYSNLDVEVDIADKMVNKLSRISFENLSNLATTIHNNPIFSVIILVILESTSIRSLLVMPSSFAGIIEQLSKYLNVEENGLEKPIKNSKLESTIVQELHEVIDKNHKGLTPESISKLKRRLNGINRPTNKKALTNNEKLTRPFERLKIDLTLHDISIIEHRNDLFHGNILLKTSEIKDEETTNLYIAYVSAKLFTLISKLILKNIGYSGYIYNQAKYLENRIGLKTKEQYFDKI
jgi:hypothetical protein